MREKPILFSGPMVRAILEGRKTQTRRVVKPQPIVAFYAGNLPTFRCTGFKFYSPGYTSGQLVQFCAYGQVGDRLWVRETWMIQGADCREPLMRSEQLAPEIIYRADTGSEHYGRVFKWRSSMFMPHWASRITLEITDIRVERLQEITIDDLSREGVDLEDGIAADAFNEAEHFASGGCPLQHYPEIYGFAALWDSINGKKHPWASNPWVWVIEFKRIEKEGQHDH